jgi:hypothetical protein
MDSKNLNFLKNFQKITVKFKSRKIPGKNLKFSRKTVKRFFQNLENFKLNSFVFLLLELRWILPQIEHKSLNGFWWLDCNFSNIEFSELDVSFSVELQIALFVAWVFVKKKKKISIEAVIAFSVGIRTHNF